MGEEEETVEEGETKRGERKAEKKEEYLPDSLPRTRRPRRGETVAADRWCGVRYTEVHVDRFEELGVLEGPRDALHIAVARLHDPWIELALDGEREGGRRDQANEYQEEFHLATLPSPVLPATDHARHDLWITSARLRNDRSSFTSARLTATPPCFRRPGGRHFWKYQAGSYGSLAIDHSALVISTWEFHSRYYVILSVAICWTRAISRLETSESLVNFARRTFARNS